MKKILTIFLGIILVLSLFACKGDDDSNNSSNKNSDNESSQGSAKYPWGDEEITLPDMEL